MQITEEGWGGARETEVLYSIRRSESEIAKDRAVHAESEKDRRIIDYKSKTVLYRTTHRKDNSTEARQAKQEE
jgi:hypothetical protein